MEKFRRMNLLWERTYDGELCIMVKCDSCKRTYKLKEISRSHSINIIDYFDKNNDFKCLHCENVFSKENTKIVKRKAQNDLFFNASTIMFNDVKENNKFTLSFTIASSEKGYEVVYPVVGNTVYRLKLRFDLDKRTAVIYISNIPGKDNTLNQAKGFENVTLPYCNNTKARLDIIIPKKVVRTFCKEIGVKYPEGYEVSWEDMQWLNKTRKPINKARRDMYICHMIKSKYYQYKYDLDGDKEYLERVNNDEDEFFYNKKEIERRVDEYSLAIKYPRKIYRIFRKYLKEGETDKNKKEIFNYLLEINKTTVDYIPKNLLKYYWEYPYALEMVKEHHCHLTNIDRRRNIIKDTEKMFRKNKKNFTRFESHILHGKHYDSYKYDINGFDANSEIDTLKEVFSEEDIYRKLLGSHRFDLLVDTACNISEIRKKGANFKTKGCIQKLHDESSQYLRNLDLSEEQFNNVRSLKDFEVGNGVYIRYAHSQKELGMVGNALKNCVTGYTYNCKRGSTQIAFLEKDRKIEGCLEIETSLNSNDNKSLVQAKGYGNCKLSRKNQKYIQKYCEENEIYISTSDINKKIKKKVNEKLEKEIKIKKVS
jgi:hypothetical protein